MNWHVKGAKRPRKIFAPNCGAKNFLGFTLDEPVYICYSSLGKKGKV
jgi:hypothetical protein